MIARVAHHFNDAHQQFHAATLGMWIFLGTEVMFFGGLFAGYTAYRFQHPEAFEAASRELHVGLGAINTGVLLLSSLLVALSVHAAYTGRGKLTAGLLAGAIVMGLVFLGIKAYEYGDKWSHHRVPGPHFQYTPHAEGEAGHDGAHAGSPVSEFKDPHIPRDQAFEGEVQLFYSFYFAMTGLHAIHMVIGVVLLAVIAVAALRGAFSHEYYTPVEVGGLYWHFVDIVWVFLFPLLYLIR
jgi:cytochrome c oxidase subunit III